MVLNVSIQAELHANKDRNPVSRKISNKGRNVCHGTKYSPALQGFELLLAHSFSFTACTCTIHFSLSEQTKQS